MILKTKEFKDTCSIILAAIDSDDLSRLTETLELKTQNDILYLNVTNREYYASVKFKLDKEENFHATVNAILFLKLIDAITTEYIELLINSTYITIKANGNYKIPLIFDKDKLLELPVIYIDNKTVEMTIEGDILNSILQYNSKELIKASRLQGVQKLYYIDQEGCITFTSGACVNNFHLEKPIKILINNKLVKLFKLFKDVSVKFSLGYDSLDNNIIQTKVTFETDNIRLTAITPSDDDLLDKVPVIKIRSLANKNYDNNLILNKDALLQAINRLLLFGSKTEAIYGDFKCSIDNLVIGSGENVETIKAENDSKCEQEYLMSLNLVSLKLVLESCVEQYISMSFGDKTAITLSRGHIVNVIPETIKRENIGDIN